MMVRVVDRARPLFQSTMGARRRSAYLHGCVFALRKVAAKRRRRRATVDSSLCVGNLHSLTDRPSGLPSPGADSSTLRGAQELRATFSQCRNTVGQSVSWGERASESERAREPPTGERQVAGTCGEGGACAASQSRLKGLQGLANSPVVGELLCVEPPTPAKA